jgi:hypothetical protein
LSRCLEYAVVRRSVRRAARLLAEAAILFFQLSDAREGGGQLGVGFAEGGGGGFEVGFGLLAAGDGFLQFGAITELGEFGVEFVDAGGGVVLGFLQFAGLLGGLGGFFLGRGQVSLQLGR